MRFFVLAELPSLLMIANAPNLAGVGILRDAKVFQEESISPLGLFLGA